MTNQNKFLSILGRIKPTHYFWFLIIVMAFIYGFNKIIFSRPVGIHQWRNCVSAGYAQCFYHGADFFKPKTEAFVTNKHTSRIVILECPLLYYVVGQIYKIFGNHEFLYRLFNILIGFLGLLCLFKTAKFILEDTVLSLFISVILFSSTVYIFYMSNFITDAPAMALSLIGFYFFYRFYLFKRDKYLLISMLLFAIAGLLKAQALYLYFALFAIFMGELIFKMKFGKDGKYLFDNGTKYFLYFIIVIVFMFAWYAYSKYFSQKFGAINSARLYSAIWYGDKELIKHVWNEFVTRFKVGYFHSPVFIYSSFIIFLHNLIFISKHNKLLNFITILLFIQVIIFNLVFFLSIGRCDYYNINSFAFILFVYLNFFYYMKKNYFHIYNNLYFKMFFIIVGCFLIAHGKKGIDRKYSDIFFFDTSKLVHKCGYIEPYLRNLGIEREDRVYYTPDPSMNNSLYLMNQLGNTDFAIGGPLKQRIEYLKERDLKYLMIGDEMILKNDTTINEYTTSEKKVGEFNGVHIFKIE